MPNNEIMPVNTKKAFDTRRAGRILVRHQPPPRHHKNTNPGVYNYKITNNQKNKNK